MESFDIDFQFIMNAVAHATQTSSNSAASSFRSRSQSGSHESGYGSYPCTPSKNSQCYDAVDSFDFPSPFTPLERQLTKVETLAIHRIAQKIAAHRIQFGYVEKPEQNIFNYESVAGPLTGVVGQSTKGLPSSSTVLAPIRKPYRQVPKSFCQFCKNNEEVRCAQNGKEPDTEIWTNHRLKDRNGNCSCPILRAHTCEFCGQSGDKAHTIRYCEAKKQYDLNLI